MKFTANYKIKWHDTDSNRRVRPSQVMMYMQETANLHLAAYAMNLDRLRDEKGLAFLLSRATVQLYLDLHDGDEITVSTWICDSRGLSFNRCFAIYRGEELVAEAFTVWGLLDLKEHKLLRTQQFTYPFDGDVTLQLPIPSRVHLPSAMVLEEAGERRIGYSDIDYNRHMNNTHYPDMLCDFTPDILNRRVRGFTLSYLHEATYGHTLRVLRGETEGGYFFRTVDGDGTVCLEALLLLEDAREVQSSECKKGNMQ